MLISVRDELSTDDGRVLLVAPRVGPHHQVMPPCNQEAGLIIVTSKTPPSLFRSQAPHENIYTHAGMIMSEALDGR